MAAKVKIDIPGTYGDRLELFNITPKGRPDSQGEFIPEMIYNTDLFAYDVTIGWRKKDENGVTSTGQFVVELGSHTEETPYTDLIDSFVEIPALHYQVKSGISKYEKHYEMETFSIDEILPASNKTAAPKASRFETPPVTPPAKA